MKVQLTDLGPLKRSLDIEVPTDRIDPIVTGIVKEFTKHAKVPGFRPGRAPAEVVRNRYRDEIRNEMLHKVLPSTFTEVIEEQKLEVAGQPDFTEIEHKHGEPLKYRAVFEVYPNLDSTRYAGIPVDPIVITVESSEVDHAIEHLREARSEMIPVEDAREIRKGDFVDIQPKGTITGTDETHEPKEPVLVEVGSERTVREFSEHLIGAHVGDMLSFQVKYPDDFRGAYAGKSVDYEVKVLAIKEKKLPALDDEFAKSFGDNQTIDDLRSETRRRIEESKRAAARTDRHEKIIEWLQQNNVFDVPEVLVDSQTQVRLERMARGLMNRGVHPNQLNLDWKQVGADEKAQAEKDVRGSLILDFIGDRENVTVSEEEVEAELRRISEATGQALGDIKRHYSEQNADVRLRGRIRNEKVLDLLLERAAPLVEGSSTAAAKES